MQLRYGVPRQKNFRSSSEDSCASGEAFETLGFEALKPKAETVTFPLQHLDAVTGLIEEDEEYEVEHGDFGVQLDSGGEAVDGVSKIHRLGLEVNLFDFPVGMHHGRLAPESNRERSIGDELDAWSMGMMDPLRITKPYFRGAAHRKCHDKHESRLILY